MLPTSPRLPILGVGLLLLVLAIAVYAPLLSPGRVAYSRYSDVVAQHLATKEVGHRAWAAAHAFPLWRDDQFAGGPALGNPQALYLHPLHAAFLFVSPAQAVGPTFVLLLWIAALGCFAFARALGASRLGAGFSACSGLCAFKFVLTVQAGWLAPLTTIALVPGVLAAFVRLVERPVLGRMLVFAGLLAVGLAGGTPQVLYYAALLTLPYALWFLWASPEPFAAAHLRRTFGFLLVASLLGVASNAYLWLPVVRDLPLLARTHPDYAFFLSGHGLSLSALASLLRPDWSGSDTPEPWESVAYFGVVPLVLALPIALRPLRGVERYFGGAFVLSLLLSLDTPLLRGLYSWMPGYSAFRLPARMLFVSAFLGLGLAGVGFDRLQRALRARGSTHLPLAFAVVAFALSVGEGAYRARPLLTTERVEALGPAADHPARALRAELRPGERVAVVGRAALPYGWAAQLGLSLVNGYDPYHYAHYQALLALLDTGRVQPAQSSNWVDVRQLARPDLLDELAIRYVLAQKPLALPNLVLREQRPAVRTFVLYKGAQSRSLFVYENPTVRAYARFATQAFALASNAAVLQRLEREHLRGQAYVVEAFASNAGTPAPGANDDVRVESRVAGRVVLHTQSDAVRLLVVTEVFHPGWRALLDGRAVPVLQVNGVLLGVRVPVGAHRVELAFRAPGFDLGVGVSLAALALLCGLSARTLLRSRRGT